MLALSRITSAKTGVKQKWIGKLGLFASSSMAFSSQQQTGPFQLTASQGWWCCTAACSCEDGKQVNVSKIAGYPSDELQWPHLSWSDQDASSSEIHSSTAAKVLDLTKAPDWMEAIEISEGRYHHKGGAGAYDTLRCDIQSEGDPVIVWGQDYHLKRIQRSFQALGHQLTKQEQDLARKQSDSILNALLEMAQQSKHIAGALEHATDKIQMVRLTWLWSEDETHKVQVRGHACCSMVPFSVFHPSPIVCSLGATRASNRKIQTNGQLPNRFLDPQTKIAAWTRDRKQLEHPDAYKPPGVSEVLMLQPTGEDGDMEILEGLSSNFFVVYDDGTLRTAEKHVLHGYTRDLVLESAPACGLKIPNKPALLSEVLSWKEAFITSSSRLIYPISKIVLREETSPGKFEFRDLWVDKAHSPYWQKVLDEVLLRGGYKTMVSSK